MLDFILYAGGVKRRAPQKESKELKESKES